MVLNGDRLLHVVLAYVLIHLFHGQRLPVLEEVTANLIKLKKSQGPRQAITRGWTVQQWLSNYLGIGTPSTGEDFIIVTN